MSFTFTGDTQPTLTDVDVTVPTGRIVAVVGPTGSGKSTLVELTGGLIGPDSGTVATQPGTRSMVFQEAFLFSGTIRENVDLGGGSGDDQIWAALRLSRADRFVSELGEGLDTVVGERGVSLSGGQRQRIALARALIRRPGLLLLDDTTSALDPETERVVLGNLRDSLAGTTVLMVASRPSTIALADDVIYLERGTVVDHGTHQELMDRSAPLPRAGRSVRDRTRGCHVDRRRRWGRWWRVTEPLGRFSAVRTIGRGLEEAPVLRQGLGVTWLLAAVGASGRVVVPILLQQAIDKGIVPEDGVRVGFVGVLGAHRGRRVGHLRRWPSGRPSCASAPAASRLCSTSAPG